MTLEEYIISFDFLQFQDEQLRQNACEAVERFLRDNEPVKNAQLHSIPLMIRARGISGLKDLTEKQKSKNTHKENKAFWEFVSELILTYPGPDYSLRRFIHKELATRGLLDNETEASDEKEQKRIRKANKLIVEKVRDHMLAIYFEHFNCHYFYKNRQGAPS